MERPASWRFYGATFTGDGSRIYLRDDAAIIDAHTGAVLVSLPVKPEEAPVGDAQKGPAAPHFGTMLRDGSVIVTRDSKLFHIDANGHIAGEVPLPVLAAYVVGQVGTSKVLLEGEGRLMIVDLAANKVEVAVSGVSSPLLSGSSPVVPQFADNATFVGIGRARTFLLWDARTGAKRRLPS